MIDEHPAHGRYMLRLATESDRDFVLTLWRESLGPYVAPLFGHWDEAAAGRNFAAKQNNGLLIIIVDAQAVGVLHMSQEKDWLFLNEVELVSSVRQQGLGTQIMADINAYADTNTMHLELQVLATNPAKRLYERVGFETTHFKMHRKPERRQDHTTGL